MPHAIRIHKNGGPEVMRFEEVDISTSADLQRRFGEEIPVTFVDGEQHDYWRVDPERLRRALV